MGWTQWIVQRDAIEKTVRNPPNQHRKRRISITAPGETVLYWDAVRQSSMIQFLATLSWETGDSSAFDWKQPGLVKVKKIGQVQRKKKKSLVHFTARVGSCSMPCKANIWVIGFMSYLSLAHQA